MEIATISINELNLKLQNSETNLLEACRKLEEVKKQLLICQLLRNVYESQLFRSEEVL